MSQNIIHAAVDLVDLEPSDEFVAELGQQLLDELIAPHPTEVDAPLTPHSSPPETTEDVVVVTHVPSLLDRQRKRRRILLAAAACLALFAAAAIILNRPDDSSEPDQLTDVDEREARPLGDRAGISVSVLGGEWNERADQGGVPFSALEAETTKEIPQCAALADFGVWSPTTKSVTAHQFFEIGRASCRERVYVLV